MSCGGFVPSTPKILSHLALQTERLVSGNVFIYKAPSQSPQDGGGDFLLDWEVQGLGPLLPGPAMCLSCVPCESPQQPDCHAAFPLGMAPSYKSLGGTHSS